MRCKLVGWEEVQALIRELALRLAGDGFAPDILVAIGRGGWVPGRLLSDFLGNPNLTEIKVEHYIGTHRQAAARIRYPLRADVRGQRVLVVDDVTDTGESLRVALGHIRPQGPAALRTLVLHHKRASPFVPDYFARELVEWRWVIYPWALVEDLTALIGPLRADPANLEALAARLLRDNGIRVPAALLRDVLTFDAWAHRGTDPR